MFLILSVIINLLAFLFIKYLINVRCIAFSIQFVLNMLCVYAFYRNEPADINLIGTLLIFQLAMYVVFGLIEYGKACGGGWYDSSEKFSLLDDIKSTLFVFLFILLGILATPFVVIIAIVCVACITYDGLNKLNKHIKRNWDELVGH
jgi:hypothetical protein